MVYYLFTFNYSTNVGQSKAFNFCEKNRNYCIFNKYYFGPEYLS